MDESVDLIEVAKQAMRVNQLLTDYPPEVIQELNEINQSATPSSPEYHDMRNLLWVSIDQEDTFDLDQLTYAEVKENGDQIIYVAIADVDSLVKKGSFIDQYASKNTTSIYTPLIIFSMLPTKFSNDLTSLNEQSDRCAIVTAIKIEENGEFTLIDIYPAWVRNQAKLSYNQVYSYLKEKTFTFPLLEKIPQLSSQIILQDRLTQLIKINRYRQGTLPFNTKELVPILNNGKVVGFESTPHNRANALIENFMIITNICVTKYLLDKNIPVIKRVVKTPNRWDRIRELAENVGESLPLSPDVKALQKFMIKMQRTHRDQFPELSLSIIKLIGRGEYIVGYKDEFDLGHFDLGIRDYSHTTAPNRRFVDLILQRLLKSELFKKPLPYTQDELTAIANHCTIKDNDATKVERRVRKSAIAMVLEKEIGQTFHAIVTGTGDKGTWVRVMDTPIEGKLIEGFVGLDVGDHIEVKLTYVNSSKGFIDFIRINLVDIK